MVGNDPSVEPVEPVENVTLLQVRTVSAEAVDTIDSQEEFYVGQQRTADGHRLQTVQTTAAKHASSIPTPPHMECL